MLDLSRVTFLGGTAIQALLHTERHARTTGQHLTLLTDTHPVDRPLQALDLTCRFTYGDQPAFDPEKAAAPAAPSAQPPPAPRASGNRSSHPATTG